MNSFVSVNVFQNIHYYSFRILNCFWGYISVINDGKCCISYRQNVMEIPNEFQLWVVGEFFAGLLSIQDFVAFCLTELTAFLIKFIE